MLAFRLDALVKVLYVMGKAVSGELSCMQTSLVQQKTIVTDRKLLPQFLILSEMEAALKEFAV